MSQEDDYTQPFEGQPEQHRLSLVRTETARSLQTLGVSRDIPSRAINNPTGTEHPIFPEEYTLETATGLVPIHQLQSLGRTVTKEEKDTDSSSSVPSEAEFVTFVVDDPENPLNWDIRLRWFYTVIYAIFVICAAYGSSCLATGLPTINKKFGVSTEVSTLTVSLMVLGFCVGPLIWAPMSEQIGRKPVYVISFGLYVIFNIPCALAPNIGALLACRFLCGVFASSALTNIGASIVDIHSETRSLAIAFFSFAPYSGPVLGGVVNGFISVGTGRFDIIIWVNMAFAGVMWIIIIILPETYAPAILKKRAKKLRKETGNQNIMTEQEAHPLTLKQLINDNLIRPLRFIIEEPVLDLMCAFVALIYSLLYAFFFAYPVIFNELYGYKDNIIGLMFIPILIGALLALTTTPIIEKKYAELCKRRTPTPEDRLIGAMIGSPFPCIALFILGATSYKHIIWVGPASSGIAFGYGMVLIYYSLNNYIIDTYAKYAASALATKVFLRSSGGAAFPLFVTQMYHRLGLQWASWLLAFISLAMIAIPFSFYKYGASLRAKLCKEDYTLNSN
ncbi:MFS general substrate transporter [Suhomyces tanzawaensis NRRL Y-17324]|uniref:MFS general substrate transporter n=1 Tax=Suhomyces tanzawaensis NRRL Y-17324 TaxID=984487 RepID=A0A1E4SQI2_9ASCO|nr:MFS general substrate transporter [Suhomyces tanzawaensis NRRL Y-17324]ODV81755.1 MFS general substrate transporter [Suhomyces tanzawaensis NRRL Y-17324]